MSRLGRLISGYVESLVLWNSPPLHQLLHMSDGMSVE